ncbi:hypothetical protein CH379_012085 [Leptospira ellisii]|uniref:Uncharacterized protein n=1 Tax=Leptospira ellisii TaxID=2023197 RepID=A0AAE4QP49_9LEPT|nr:hypothetical protein [Leptospira ellisii]MDV6236366.1 hypothetical protein [Leptospira ellisii]
MFFRMKTNFLAQFLLIGALGFGMSETLSAAENSVPENAEIEIHQNEVDRILAVAISQTKTSQDWFVAEEEIFLTRSVARSGFGSQKYVGSPAEVAVSPIGAGAALPICSFDFAPSLFSVSWNVPENFISLQSGSPAPFIPSSLSIASSTDGIDSFSRLNPPSFLALVHEFPQNVGHCSKIFPIFLLFSSNSQSMVCAIQDLYTSDSIFSRKTIGISDRIVSDSPETRGGGGNRSLFLQKKGHSALESVGGRKTKASTNHTSLILAKMCGNSPAELVIAATDNRVRQQSRSGSERLFSQITSLPPQVKVGIPMMDHLQVKGAGADSFVNLGNAAQDKESLLLLFHKDQTSNPHSPKTYVYFLGVPTAPIRKNV